jgi:ATP-binding cassette, subfamily B, bacterial
MLSGVRDDVLLDDVWFRYDPEAPWTLSEIAAEIPTGTRTALVGETGSGKTTLAYLVARLYEPERGCVSIDGVDIRDVTLRSLADTVGLVSQETYLFHASIRETLRFTKAWRQRRGDRTGRARGPDPRADRLAPRWLRDARRRARLPLLRR